MSVFAVTYAYVPVADELARLRPERHAFFARLEQEGALLASGQLLDGDLGDGLLVLEAPDAGAAAAALDADPYVRAELVTRRTICAWNPTSGSWVTR